MNSFQKYSSFIPLQIGVFVIFFIYITGLSFGIIVFSETIFPPKTSPERTSVTVTLFIESTHPDYLFNYTYTSNVSLNISLIEHLNNTIGSDSWEGRYYTPGGWFITRIFNATEDDNWSWRIYYRLSQSASWTYAPVGASSILLDNDYFIKFSFEQG